MSSTRLPGKVLMELCGHTALARVVSRLQSADLIDEILVATTDFEIDDAIVAESQKLCVAVFRGDQDDVLDRYYRAAEFIDANTVVRVTSDCPLIDPEITDKTVATFFETKADYTSNVLNRTYPRGLDTEVFSVDALRKAWENASKRYQREHVTPYIYEHPHEFKIAGVSEGENHNDHRWTLDTPEDLEFIRAVYERMTDRPKFSWRDVLVLLEQNPELVQINQSVAQKKLHV